MTKFYSAIGLILAATLVLFAFGCSGDSSDDTTTTEAKILTFVIPAADNLTVNGNDDLVGVIDHDAKTIRIKTANVTNYGEALKVTFTVSDGAAVKMGTTAVASGGELTFTENTALELMVTNGSMTATYMVYVGPAMTAAEMTEFSFMAASNDAIDTDVKVTVTGTAVPVSVPAGTVVTALKATFMTSPFATVKVGTEDQVSGTTVNDFSNPVTYAVTAEDGTTTEDYTVTVTVGATQSSEAMLLTYKFLDATNTGKNLGGDIDGTVDETAKTVALSVPTGATLTGLIADFTVSTGAKLMKGTTDQVSGTTANDFTSGTGVDFIVQAEDGTTEVTYSITVTAQ